MRNVVSVVVLFAGCGEVAGLPDQAPPPFVAAVSPVLPGLPVQVTMTGAPARTQLAFRLGPQTQQGCPASLLGNCSQIPSPAFNTGGTMPRGGALTLTSIPFGTASPWPTQGEPVWVQVAARSAAGMPLGALSPVKRIVGCGDGVIGRGEICDDGGVAPGDGCSALCACEADGDRDGVCDVDDGCPLDPLQDDPGACGCGYDELPTGACPVCPRDEVEGCDGTCEDDALLGDRTCDANLDCATAGFDGGDCHAPRAPARLVGGSGLGGGILKLYRQDLSPSLDLTPYGANWAGGVRVASGDINGDGRSEIITGAGPGAGPHVKVFDGSNGVQLLSFFAYDATFTGGVHVAAGDVTGDGIDDIVTGAGAGAGPHVKVFDGVTGAALSSFFAFSSGFAGGVTVAAGDITGDGRADILVGSGPGGAAQVKVFDGATLNEVRSFFPFGTTFTGGVTVASGDVNGDRSDDILVGAGPGLAGAPIVVKGADGTELGTLVPYVPNFTGGVRVAAGDLNADGRDEILAGPGDGGEATLSGYDFRTGALTVSVGMAPFGTTTGAWIAAFQP